MIDYDYFCRRCKNYKYDLSEGILCALTDKKKPDFINECPDFVLDPEREQKLINEQTRLARAEARSEALGEDGGFFAPEKKGINKGVLGGIIMVAIAVIWFFGGLAAGYIFFYPPILFVIGVYALIKGIVTGNLSGKKKLKPTTLY